MQGERIEKLVEVLRAEKDKRERAFGEASKFTDLLFDHLEKIVTDLSNCYEGIDAPIRKSNPNGTKELTFKWDDTSLSFFQSNSAALPANTGESQSLPKAWTGKQVTPIWLFAKDSYGSTGTIYRIYVFEDGKWSGYGYGWNMASDHRLEPKEAKDLAMKLLEEYVADVKPYWRPLHEISPDSHQLKSRGPLGFETPS